MRLTPFIAATAPVCCAAIVLSFLILFCWLWHGRFFRSIAAVLLGSSICAVLAVNAEMHLFSYLPLRRPLDWLPLLHGILVAAAALIGYRRHGRDFFQIPIRTLSTVVRATWSELPLVIKVAAGLTVAILLLYTAFGAYENLGAFDELAYHAPQAIQPYQDGREGDLDNVLPWTYAYPKGAAMVWSWTLFWTHGDVLFRPVQVALGIQFLLAVYLLARRLGADAASALCAAVALSWMPIFYRVTTICGADIGFAGATLAALAFSIRPREANSLAGSLAFSILAFGQACLIKLPIVATVFFGFGLVLLLLVLAQSRALGSLSTVVRSRAVWLAMVALPLCCYSYIRDAIDYGNPLYPLTITAGNHVIFRGPHPSVQQAGIGSHTTMTRLSRNSIIEMYYAAWTDWFAPLDEDSLGSVGPGLLVGAVMLFVAGALHALATRDPWTLGIAALFAVGVLIPGSYQPRYGLPITALVFTGAAAFLARIPSSARSPMLAAILLVSSPELITCLHNVKLTLDWTAASNGGTLLTPRRGLSITEHNQTGFVDHYPTPQLIAFLREHCGAGTVLAWDVDTFQTLLWNTDYSNRTIFLPGTQRDRYPAGPFTFATPSGSELQAWRKRVESLDPDFILLYTASPYAALIRDDPRYRIAFQDAAERGKGAMTLFERAAPQSRK